VYTNQNDVILVFFSFLLRNGLQHVNRGLLLLLSIESRTIEHRARLLKEKQKHVGNEKRFHSYLFALPLQQKKNNVLILTQTDTLHCEEHKQ